MVLKGCTHRSMVSGLIILDSLTPVALVQLSIPLRCALLLLLTARPVLRILGLSRSRVATGLQGGSRRPRQAAEAHRLLCLMTSEFILGLTTQTSDLTAHQVFHRFLPLHGRIGSLSLCLFFKAVARVFKDFATTSRVLCLTYY